MGRATKRVDFTRVKNLETGQTGTVVEFLSSQFTVKYDNNKKVGFLFYVDRDVNWIPLGE